MKALYIITLLVLLLPSSNIMAKEYYDLDSEKYIDYYEPGNGGILIDKKLIEKYELSFSNENENINRKFTFNYEDTINNAHRVIIENEINKLSTLYTGRVEIISYHSDSKYSFTTRTIYSLNNGLITGEQKVYFNDSLLRKVTYEKGVANGNETIYWFNGIPAVTGSWDDGYMSGKWIANYINGKKGLEWNMDNGVLNGVIQSWDYAGHDLTIGTYKSNNNINGKFIFLYCTPIDYIYRVASPIHIIENKNKYTISSYNNGKSSKSSKILLEATQDELKLLDAYINKNKPNMYATLMSFMLPMGSCRQ